MKIALILATFIMTTARADIMKLLNSKHPKRYSKVTNYLVSKGYYFSAVSFAKEHMVISRSTMTPQFDESVEKLIIKTGIDHFSILNESILKKSKAPSINYVLAKKKFESNDLSQALMYLKLIDDDHRLSAEGWQLRGVIFLKSNKVKQAELAFEKCQEIAKIHKKKNKEEKIQRFYGVIENQCIADLARLYYKNGDFKKAIEQYERVPKTSYIWPYLLLEKAWTYFKLKDYNRSLGILVTFKSPLLDSYFLPESEMLQALSYFNMCLWDDSLTVINNYHTRYSPEAKNLKSELTRYNASDRFFFDMVFNEEDVKLSLNKERLISQIRKEIYFNLNLQNLHRVKHELESLDKQKESKFKGILVGNLKSFEERQKDILNWYVKKKMFQFINEMHKYSKELYKVNLEIYSRKKSLIYDDKNPEQGRLRGDMANVNRTPYQYFWKFRGAFWADELGDYSFGLKSQCEGQELI